jgi:hypothetical protein
MARRRKNAYKPGAPAEAGHDVAALSRHRGASGGFGCGCAGCRLTFGAQQSGGMSKRTIETLARRVAFALVLAAAAAAVFGGHVSAQQLSADCQRLREAIADASRGDSGAQYQAAADRQRAELDRTVAYAKSIGCDRHQFLFFGAPPPPQCGEINAQVGRMRANLDELQQRAGSGPGGRGELIARFNAQCTTAQQQPQQQQQPANFLDAIFGNLARQPSDVQTVPLNPDQPVEGAEAEAGSKAVCVRACDGAFFPVSYSASQGRLGGLDDMCHALCPNADVSLYTYPPSGQIEQAVSINGAKYMDLPNALKYRTSLDPTCSCKRKGESWADALAGAEAKLGRESKGDVFVTPEKSIELSRPKLDAKTKAKTPADAKATPGATPAAATADPVVDALSQQAATISREASGIAGGDAQTGAKYGEGQGQTVDSVDPDGVKRKVRIIDPTL